jgi:hypothetical protein
VQIRWALPPLCRRLRPCRLHRRHQQLAALPDEVNGPAFGLGRFCLEAHLCIDELAVYHRRAGYVVRDANDQALAYIYSRATESEAMQAKVLTNDEARRLARQHREAGDAVAE